MTERSEVQTAQPLSATQWRPGHVAASLALDPASPWLTGGYTPVVDELGSRLPGPR